MPATLCMGLRGVEVVRLQIEFNIKGSPSPRPKADGVEVDAGIAEPSTWRWWPQAVCSPNSCARACRPTSISPLKSFALGLNAERTLVQGRTVRVGNAAQTLHPVAGQGLNLGLRDVHELVAVLRWTQDLDAALRRAEWARAADRWSTIAATDFLARSFTWKLPGAATARGLGLAALQALPGARAWLARRMMFGGR